MSERQEAAAQYAKALKVGQKCYNDRLHRGWYPYTLALDDILDETSVAGYVELGLVDVPLDLIEGTKTAGRQSVFAANFFPLMPTKTEFSEKWINLCAAHLGATGIRDPIKCYEYMGRFYVQEGNKRVSVLKSFDAVTIPGYVTRVVPMWSEDKTVKIYYEFMRFYELSRVYRVHFNREGGFAKLQAALGFDPDHVWTEEERVDFLARFGRFKRAYDKLNTEHLSATTAEALLVWMQVYPIESLETLSAAELEKSLTAIWTDIKTNSKGAPIAVNTEPGETAKKGTVGRILGSVLRPSHLNVAFVYEAPPEQSSWLLTHDHGRQHLAETLKNAVTVQTYLPQPGESGESVMERAAKEGADVIFAPMPEQISACRKIAAKYPDIKILNCSVAMPFTGVRTYHSRVYEGAFLTGAVAGAMAGGDRVGYISEAPLYGTPAAINAFALGVQLTNPRARVRLRWTCVPGSPLKEMAEQGIEVVFCRNNIEATLTRDGRGLYQLSPDGKVEPLAMFNWNWGGFYVRLVNSILQGGWDELNTRDNAVSYWWGLGSGAINVVMDSSLPEGVRTMASILYTCLVRGELDVFHRPIRSQDGTVRNNGRQWFSPDEILHMDWLCSYVDGDIPAFDKLLPQSKSIVRLQGVYRDQIPPEKEEVQV